MLAQNHDDFGSTRLKIILIDSNKSERDRRSSSRNLRKLDCAAKPLRGFAHPAYFGHESIGRITPQERDTKKWVPLFRVNLVSQVIDYVSCFDAFSQREPVSTSLENALALR